MKVIEIEGIGETHAAKLGEAGIASDADLLEEAGVDTVPELARRNPANLHATIEEVVARKGLVRRPPSEGMNADRISEAASLNRTIEY